MLFDALGDGVVRGLVDLGVVVEVAGSIEQAVGEEGPKNAANVQVEAATTIQLHVGDSTFTMDKAGKVQIKANDIILDAKTISFSGQTSVETTGGQVNSTATGTHTIKGALVKIN